MAMTISSLKVQATISWNVTNALTGLDSTSNNSSFTYSLSFAHGTGAAGTADILFAIQTTIAGAGNYEPDLAGSLLDFFGNTLTMARVKCLYVHLTTDTAASGISIGNAAAPWVNWISAATSTVKVYNGGLFLLAGSGATQYAVTAGTGDDLKILNDDASVTATVKVCIIGSTV